MVNVGSLDRTLRIAFGAILVIAPFVPPLAGVLAQWGAWKFVLPAAGLVLLGTAFFRFCPAYTLFGIRTCKAARNG